MEQRVDTWLLTTSLAFAIAICPGWQVASARLQWVLQHWRAPRWRDRAFCRTRSGLEQSIRELVGREHQAAVAHLPDWHPDVDGVPDPKWRRRGKRMVLDLGLRGGSTVARGNAIREQVLAQQHLPNPITIILPDGTTTRVWLATGKDGKKIIGDALEWGINCAGRTETPLEVVNSRETAPGDHDTPGARPNSCCPFGPTPGALQGDDVQLEYYSDGTAKIPPCLDRRSTTSKI
jgi:hypothetical protein